MKLTNTDYLVESLLSKKRNDATEIFITFFEKCNLACSFCWQDHNDQRGMSTILEKVKDVVRLIEESPQSEAHINMMGGELFTDSVPYKTFSDYFDFCMQVEQQTSKVLRFNFVTNLVFRNHSRVRSLMNRCQSALKNEVNLTTSFDFCGRFNQESLHLFKSNLERFRDVVKTVSVVLTSQNIEALLKDTNEHFKYIYYQGFQLYFDTYSPQKLAKELTPTDLQMQTAYKFLIDHYPNSLPVAEWLKREPAKLSCMTSKIVTHEGFVGNCGSIVKPEEKSNYDVEVTPSTNSNMEAAFLEKNECLSCSYFSRCSLGCFLLHSSKMKYELQECFFKGVHKHIDRKLDTKVFYRKGSTL